VNQASELLEKAFAAAGGKSSEQGHHCHPHWFGWIWSGAMRQWIEQPQQYYFAGFLSYGSSFLLAGL
jgi:hypothetical protein